MPFLTDAAPALTRPDWRESLSTAADLALLGIVVVVGCLPVITAGATLTAATTAVDHMCRTRSLPSLRESAGTAARGSLGGLAATVVMLFAVTLILFDMWLLTSGMIPGGAPAVVAIGGVAAGLVALCATTVVRVGQTDGTGWRAAAAWSARLLLDRPTTAVAVLAAVVVPVALGLAVPVISVLLPGFALFALHAVVRRARP